MSLDSGRDGEELGGGGSFRDLDLGGATEEFDKFPPDFFGGELIHAALELGTVLGAAFVVASGTGDIGGDEGVLVAGRTGPFGTGAGEDAKDRFSNACGEVHGAGIVGEQEVDFSQEGRQLFELGGPCEIADSREGVDASDGEFEFLATRFFGRSADNDEVETELAGGARGDDGEIFDGPEFGGPARSGVEREDWPGEGFEGGIAPGMVFGSGVNDRSAGEIADAEGFGDAPVAGVGGDIFTGVGEDDIAGQVRAFARGFESDTDRGGCGHGHETGAEKALQVEDEIEFSAAKFASQSAPISQRAFAFEGNDVVQIGVSLKEAFEFPVDDPGDFGLRKAGTQGGEEREGLDDIAEGAGLDDADSIGGQSPQVVDRDFFRHPGTLAGLRP